MDDEMESLMKNQIRYLVELHESKRALHNKQEEEHDDTKRYKARMVVEAFQQREDIDFIEISSPVVKLTTIRSILSIMTAQDLHLEQLNVKTVFLHDDLQKHIYMMQPYIISCRKRSSWFASSRRVSMT